MTAASTLPQPSLLVGRDRQWQALMDRCEKVRQGQGGSLWLAGEAGIGKTALMTQLRTWAEANGFQTLWGRHLNHAQAPPLHGLREALAQLFGIKAGDGPREIERRIVTFLSTHHPGLALYQRSLVRLLEPFAENRAELDRTLADQRQILFHCLFRLLGAVAEWRPLLLFLDDLHWADALSLDCLAYLALLTIEQPILVIGAYRPEEPASAGMRHLLLDPNTCAVPVPRLDLDGTTQMATRCGLAGNALFCSELQRRTAGVPLFVEQWLRLWQAEPEKNPLEVLIQLPEDLTRTIARRLQAFEEEELALLRLASVLGEEFSAEIAAQIAAQPLVQVLELLESLELRGGLVKAGAYDQGQLFSFHHPLVRQVTYESMPLSLRQRLHLRAGKVLDPLSEDQPELIFAVAHHYTAAQQQSQAVEVLFKAGQRVFALKGYEEAQTYYQQALDALQGQPALLRLHIEEALGDVAWELEQKESARSWWESPLQGQKAPLRRCLLYYKLSRLWSKDNPDRQWHYLQLALRESASLPHSLERAQVLTKLVVVPNPETTSREEDLAQKVSYAAAALRILRHYPKEPLLYQALLTDLSHLPDKRATNLMHKRRLIQRGLRLAEQNGNWDRLIEANNNLAGVWRGVDLEKGITYTAEALRLAEECLPPYHNKTQYQLVALIRWSLALGEQEQALKYWDQLKNTEGALSRYLESEERAGRHEAGRRAKNLYQRHCTASLILLWQSYPEEMWKILTQGLDRCAANKSNPFLFVRWWSLLQRLADKTNREAQRRELVRCLRQEHPAYFVYLRPVQWELEETFLQPERPSVRVGIESFDWKDTTHTSSYALLGDGEIEITPGPEVGLSWLGRTPCFLHQVEGDFWFETRISATSHPQRAGGVVVWQGPECFIRFASGVDHMGQVSLAWNEGKDFRFAGVGYLPENEIFLRLVRTGPRYESFVSPDGEKWYTCSQVEFESAGPVEVGLFAECNYEYGFPQPFPVHFTSTALWTTSPSEKATPLRPHPSIFLLPEPESFFGMVGQGRAFSAFCQQLQQAATSPFPLLLCGETGVGKELAARALHQLSGRSGPFIAINVAALPADLVESEIFGSQRGAFTGATQDRPGLFRAAQGGTLFLDEIGELPLDLQTKLLRALDQGQIRPLGATREERVDTCCIAATLRDLSVEVAQGRFRQDLYYRLGQPFEVPSLRERPEDLPHLVAHFLVQHGNGTQYQVTQAAMERLRAHPWPGNVRELEHVLARAAAAADLDLIEPYHLHLGPTTFATTTSSSAGKPPSTAELQRLLRECQFNVSAVGRRCGVNRRTIYRWLKDQGLDLETLRTAP